MFVIEPLSPPGGLVGQGDGDQPPPRAPEPRMPEPVQAPAPGTSRRPPRRRATWMVVLAAVMLSLAGLYGWNRARGPSVDVVAAERSIVVDRVVATGKVLPLARSRLGSVVLGTVARVDVSEGERVKRGQVLIALDDAEAQALVAQAKAALQQAEARLGQVGGVGARMALESVKQASARMEQAKADLEREKSLMDSGASTPERVDGATKAYDVAVSVHAAALAQATSSGPGGGDYRAAASQVAQARAALDAAMARLAQTRILAPADGIVLTRDVEPGDVVQPGRTLLEVAQSGWTGLTVQVDEKNLSLLRIGQSAVASADAFPLERIGAKVTFLAPAVDAARGTLEVKLEVADPPVYLRPDMTVSVVIDGGTRQGVLLVPGSAVRDAATPNPFVLVVQADRTARRDVRLGARAGDAVEVASGLEAGEIVVLTGGTPTAPGQRIRPRLLSREEVRSAL